MKRQNLLYLALALIVVIFAWSPWMGDDGGEEAIRKVAAERPEIGNYTAFDENGTLLCDGLYSTWAPFGRWVENCESGWYITFWGQIFPEAVESMGEIKTSPTENQSTTDQYTNSAYGFSLT